MLKQDVSYCVFQATDDPEAFEEQEVTEQKRFLFTLRSLRLYEEKTGRLFYEDYSKAFKTMFHLLAESGVNLEDGENTDVEKIDPEKAIEILVHPMINHFLVDVIPCLYTEVSQGVLIQTEETYNNAVTSPWLMSLIHIGFFMELFQEISASQMGKLLPKDNNQIARLHV